MYKRTTAKIKIMDMKCLKIAKFYIHVNYTNVSLLSLKLFHVKSGSLELATILKLFFFPKHKLFSNYEYYW